jgi:hypothetical protein
MKIGILFTIYNCENYVDDCLKPWFNLKEKYDITMACTSGMFKPYLELGFEPKNKKTLQKLIQYDIDYLISTGSNSLIDEDQSRNNALNFLKKNCNIIWIVDGDEFYTENQIINIVNFIESTPNTDWYSINFKNYTFTNDLFINGFCPPRIFKTDRYSGIDKFYFDNHITYMDGSDFITKHTLSIPRNIAWVKHFSWLSDDPRTPEKIKYQNSRFLNGCYFKWDDNNKQLDFDENFFKKVNEEKPNLHQEIDVFSNDFTLNFSKNENVFYIRNVTKNQDIFLKIFNSHNGILLSSTNLNLYENINLYYGFDHEKFSEMLNFKKFRIEVYSNNELIHHELIYI